MELIENTCHHARFLIQVVDFVPYFLHSGKKEHFEEAGYRHPAAPNLSPVNR